MIMQDCTLAPTLDLTNCDREPIHIPGYIQPHGLLFVLHGPELTICQISQNSADYVGMTPAQLLNQPITLLFAPHECEQFTQALFAAKQNESNCLSIPITVKGEAYLFDGLVHRHNDLLILELENRRCINAINWPGQARVDQHFLLVSQTIKRLHDTVGLRAACAVLAEEVRNYTDFDRVMVYKFHADGHGEVIAEAMAAGQEAFLGLHYPASDIPQQARQLYIRNWVRAITDVNYTPVAITPTLNPLTDAPLDLSHSVLRSVSPMHIQYLRNMGVTASMSISLIHNGQLWGLIACHHRTPKHLTYQERSACELLGVVMSLQLVTKEFSEDAVAESRQQQIQARLLHAVAEDGIREGLAADSQDLLALVDAEGAAIVFADECKLVGQTPPATDVRALVAWLQQQPASGDLSSPIFQTNSLSAIYPAAAAYRACASGLLAIPLAKAQGDYLLFFRPEVLQTVNWGGDPNKPVEVHNDGLATLTPRRSFALWQQTVAYKSLAWKAGHSAIASELRNALIVFIIERAQELTRVNQQLQQRNSELDSFAYVASHDLKEPLRGINSYAFYLSENYQTQLDSEAQARLQSLMRLTRRMDDLLDSLLHFSRVGRTDMQREAVDLNEVLDEALEMISARREETGGEIRVPRPLPVVECDRMRIREVFTNLLSNGLKYNDKAARWVEVGYQTPPQASPQASLGNGPLQFYIRDNGIGIKSRYHEQVFQMFKRLHGREQFGGGTGAGLTITQKIIERHGGRIWVESVYGEGSTFYFTLQA